MSAAIKSSNLHSFKCWNRAQIIVHSTGHHQYHMVGRLKACEDTMRDGALSYVHNPLLSRWWPWTTENSFFPWLFTSIHCLCAAWYRNYWRLDNYQTGELELVSVHSLFSLSMLVSLFLPACFFPLSLSLFFSLFLPSLCYIVGLFRQQFVSIKKVL